MYVYTVSYFVTGWEVYKRRIHCFILCNCMWKFIRDVYTVSYFVMEKFIRDVYTVSYFVTGYRSL